MLNIANITILIYILLKYYFNSKCIRQNHPSESSDNLYILMQKLVSFIMTFSCMYTRYFEHAMFQPSLPFPTHVSTADLTVLSVFTGSLLS